MIALTGATGFLGGHLASAFSREGRRLKCLARASSKRINHLKEITSSITIVDFGSPTSIEKALEGCDVLVHTIGLINGSQKDLCKVNIDYTRQVVQAAIKQNVKKVIFISSVAAILKHGPYGETKAQAENIVVESGLPYLIFRPAYIYGLGDENNTSLLIRALKRYPLVPLLGGGSFKLQPVYVENVVSLLIQALDSPHINQVYNVAGSQQISLKEMLEILAKNLKVKRKFLPIPLKPIQAILRLCPPFIKNSRLPIKQILELDKHKAFDISKTCQDFNFNPVPFSIGAVEMFREKQCVA